MNEVTGWLIFKLAVIAVGLVQLLKEGILAKVKDRIPTWVWAVAGVVFCIGVAALVEYVEAPWLINALLAVALMQVGYETLFKGLKAIVERITGAKLDKGGGTP